MTLNIVESHESRSLREQGYANQRSIEVKLYAFDDADDPADLDPVVVRAAVFSFLSGSPYGDPLYGLWFQKLELEPINRFTFIATGEWSVLEPAQEAANTPDPFPKLKWGFTTAGTTEHATHSITTIARHELFIDPQPDFHQAVGVSEDRTQIAGYERNVPQLSMWVECHFDPSDWTVSTLLTLKAMSWTYNLSDWHGWPAGTVMFTHCEAPEVTLGSAASGSPKLVPVKFYFLVRSEEDVDKGNGITFTKEPWSYCWDFVATTPDATAKSLGKSILATYEEQIYYPSDFTLLGMGS
jgi:hypothetical protein